MRTATALVATAVVLLVPACGADPPTVCADIAQQEVFVGERKSVEICFEGPGALTYSATSSDDSVVRAFMTGDNVGISGISVGGATVTVTATSEDDLSADASFSVQVPNRAPNFISTMTEAQVFLNRSVAWDLTEFFEDPDGEALTFTAATSNGNAVGVKVDGSIAEVSGLSAGASQITLKGIDPHKSEATGTIAVTVRVPVTVFEDDFDDEESLDDWDVSDAADAEVRDGSLRVISNTDGQYGIVARDGQDVTDYLIEVRMNPSTGGQTGVWWLTGEESGHTVYLFVLLEFTIDDDPVNWVFAHQEAGTDGWQTDFYSDSDLIEFEEFADFVVSLSGEGLTITVGGEELLDTTLVDASPAIGTLGLIGADVYSEYDRVELLGIANGDRAAKPRRIAQPLLDRIVAIPMPDSPVKR